MTDVRMIQGGNGASFTLEALFELRILTKMSRQDLDGDRAIEARVLRPIYLPIPPVPKGD
jgi:hypothetical protein